MLFYYTGVYIIQVFVQQCVGKILNINTGRTISFQRKERKGKNVRKGKKWEKEEKKITKKRTRCEGKERGRRKQMLNTKKASASGGIPTRARSPASPSNACCRALATCQNITNFGWLGKIFNFVNNVYSWYQRKKMVLKSGDLKQNVKFSPYGRFSHIASHILKVVI